jgi:hypothetical protein
LFRDCRRRDTWPEKGRIASLSISKNAVAEKQKKTIGGNGSAAGSVEPPAGTVWVRSRCDPKDADVSEAERMGLVGEQSAGKSGGHGRREPPRVKHRQAA